MSVEFLRLIDPRSILHAIEANLAAWYRRLAEALPGAELHEEDDVLQTVMPVAHPLFNAALQARFAHGASRQRIREVVRRWEERHLPCMWWIGPSTHPIDLADRLREVGFQPTDTLTGMAADLWSEPWVQRPGLEEDGLEVREAFDLPGLMEWAVPFAEGFGLRPELLQSLGPLAHSIVAEGEDNGAGRTMRFIVGYSERVPVSCAMLFMGAGVAGLYMVATVAGRRNRGYASAVVRAALDGARQAGLRTCVLHATPMAVSMYRRLGFVEYCRLRTLTLRPGTTAPLP